MKVVHDGNRVTEYVGSRCVAMFDLSRGNSLGREVFCRCEVLCEGVRNAEYFASELFQ